jgi:uncharacterized protein with ParB-like and HNH nuclease domain
METLSTYTFKDLIASDRKIIIPSYQRAYAWGEKQITDFIQDLIF